MGIEYTLGSHVAFAYPTICVIHHEINKKIHIGAAIKLCLKLCFINNTFLFFVKTADIIIININCTTTFR